MTVGTIFLMWVGEQIDAYGIGNGISLLIMAGILARMPQRSDGSLLSPAFTQWCRNWAATPGSNAFCCSGSPVRRSIVVWVIAITQGTSGGFRFNRAKHTFAAEKSWAASASIAAALRVNQAGVMPIIFASSLLMFPYFIFSNLW